MHLLVSENKLPMKPLPSLPTLAKNIKLQLDRTDLTSSVFLYDGMHRFPWLKCVGIKFLKLFFFIWSNRTIPLLKFNLSI